VVLRLTEFSIRRPRHETGQARTLEWIAGAHAEAKASVESLDATRRAAFAERIRRALGRYGCGPTKIRARGHAVPDVGSTDWDRAVLYDVRRNPHGRGAQARSLFFDDNVSAYFEAEYEGTAAPSEIIHVTCTGYLSPSAAQKLVAKRGWGERTRVTHAYHMGCYAAFPAVRLAAGSLQMPVPLGGSAAPRVDIVHTELCSLHFDPSDHSIEQLVVQTLFADGYIRYAAVRDGRGPGLQVLALEERLLPESADAMSWVVSDWGMHMTLARDVPEMIATSVRGFVADLYRRAGLSWAEKLKGIFAIHPGGPKIIDRVREVLELDEAQVRTSRAVLADHGNMSSATLPHIWARLVADPTVASGTLIASLAFGPGLTICGGLFRKQ